MATFEYLQILEAARLLFAFHTPNGGARSKAEAGRFKAMGVRAGVADFIVFWSPPCSYSARCGAIELKVGRRQPSDDQIDFKRICMQLGVHYALARSVDEVRDALVDWGVIGADEYKVA